MITLTEALASLCPNAEFSVEDEDYYKITWMSDDVPIPTKEQAIAEMARLEIEREAAKQAVADAKQSALNKLMALGLTKEEALALGVK